MIRTAICAVSFSFLFLFCLPPAQAGGVSPLLVGDIDMDGDIDDVDVNLLTAEVEAGTGDFLFDINGDGLVDLFDLDEWFVIYSSDSGVPLSTALVDVNFDKANTAADFQIIQSNLSQSITDLTGGNLLPDGSGLVNQIDLDLYISRGGVVPEPSALLLAGLGYLAWCLQRGRERVRA